VPVDIARATQLVTIVAITSPRSASAVRAEPIMMPRTANVLSNMVFTKYLRRAGPVSGRLMAALNQEPLGSFFATKASP